MRTKEEIKEEIAEYKALLKSNAPADEKEAAQEEINDLEKELQSLDSKKPSQPAQKAKKAPFTPKVKKATKASSEKKKPADGTPSCEELIAKFNERRKSYVASAKKQKTKSVFSGIASHVEKAITRAIKSVPISDIKDDTKQAVRDFTALQKAGENFLEEFKKIDPDGYSAKEIEATMAHVEKLINDLKKRAEKK